MMDLCDRNKKVRFYICAKKNPKADWTQKVVPSLNKFVENMPTNIKLNFFWVSDRDKYFHARGLFTGKGGITYDFGFEEPNDHEERKRGMDVRIMNGSTLDQKAKDFNEIQLSPFLKMEYKWSSHQCM